MQKVLKQEVLRGGNYIDLEKQNQNNDNNGIYYSSSFWDGSFNGSWDARDNKATQV